MQAHKSIGKKNYNAIKKDDQKYEPLMRHFEYLKNLGEVQATRVVATLVDEMQGHANCNERDLPPHIHGISVLLQAVLGIARLRCADDGNGSLHCDGGDGMEVDAGEYCSFPTYFNL
jgi:hypothetical protein